MGNNDYLKKKIYFCILKTPVIQLLLYRSADWS